MFRRFPSRRPARPVPPVVREAERNFQEGRFEEAARQFEALALRATGRGNWGPAAHLHLRAGLAFLEAGQVKPAVEHGRQALGATLRAGRPGQARQLLNQILQALETRGYHEEAESLRQEVAARMGGSPRPGVPGPRLQLPVNCPQCGAPLRPGEFRSLRPDAVQCAYCGALVQAKPLES
jgi:tetratricopeptide (TPR) repeat protein